MGLLAVFTVNLNKHEHRNVTTTAWSSKIKIKVSPPIYSMFTSNRWEYSHCKNISHAVRFDPTTIWSTEQHGSPSVNMLHYKQALRTQHMFDWQSVIQQCSTPYKFPGTSWYVHTCTLSSSSKSSGFHLKTIRTATMYRAVSRLITSLTCLQENDVQFH